VEGALRFLAALCSVALAACAAGTTGAPQAPNFKITVPLHPGTNNLPPIRIKGSLAGPGATGSYELTGSITVIVGYRRLGLRRAPRPAELCGCARRGRGRGGCDSWETAHVPEFGDPLLVVDDEEARGVMAHCLRRRGDALSVSAPRWRGSSRTR